MGGGMGGGAGMEDIFSCVLACLTFPSCPSSQETDQPSVVCSWVAEAVAEEAAVEIPSAAWEAWAAAACPAWGEVSLEEDGVLGVEDTRTSRMRRRRRSRTTSFGLCRSRLSEYRAGGVAVMLRLRRRNEHHH